MYSHEELMEVLGRRRQKDLEGHMTPLATDSVASAEHVAAMPQPKDQLQHEDPMKETGPGYETTPSTSLTQDEGIPAAHGEDGKESEAKMAKIYDMLGSKNARGLRGRAMSEVKEKGYKK